MRQLLILLLLPISIFGQVNDEINRKKVLQNNVIDSLYVFGKWDEKKGTETHLKYLGHIIMKNDGIIKILASSWIWGYSIRGINRILLYDVNNKYLGNYYVDVKRDLPIKIENNKLVFQSELTFKFNEQIPEYIETDGGLVGFEFVE